MRRERRVRDRSHTRKLGLSLTNNGESLPVPKQEGHDRSIGRVRGGPPPSTPQGREGSDERSGGFGERGRGERACEFPGAATSKYPKPGGLKQRKRMGLTVLEVRSPT